MLSLLPSLVLPQSLRSLVLDGIRCWAGEAADALPRPLGRTLDAFAADLDDLEGRVSRREDLGRRLRRERRRSARAE